MSHKPIIRGGLYLVIDPAMEKSILLARLASALEGGLQAVQIWNNWAPGADKLNVVSAVSSLCKPFGVPLLINNDWQLLLKAPDLDGIHFDHIPEDYDAMQGKVGRSIIAGVTCSGDLDVVRWAHQSCLDYISFCAMFPSPSAGTCDIVMPSTVKQAKTLTDRPLFVSGGITPENIADLRKLTSFDGVAVISGVMSTDDPFSKVKQYQNALKG